MTKHLWTAAAFVAATAVTGAARADNFNVTIEAPGVKNSTAGFAFSGVETWDTPGFPTLPNLHIGTDFNTGGVINGEYLPGVDVVAANQYGGAGGTGAFLSTSSRAGYSLALSTSNPAGINYFGFWLSALDPGNNLTFSKAGSEIFTFSAADVLAKVAGTADYFGNPDAPYKGAVGDQAYVFINFFDANGTFDTINFSENPEIGGYESDNHTVGFFTRQSGTPVSGVPEPASWALMVAGFGIAGSVMRRRATAAAAQYA
jgi:hypothetical protein